MAGRGLCPLATEKAHALQNSTIVVSGQEVPVTRSNAVTPTAEQNSKTTARNFSRTSQSVTHGVALAVCCFLSYTIITADITTAVVMVVAGISPQHAWKQPILRLIDTIVGIAVGIVGARIALKLVHRIRSPSPADLPQRHGESIP